MRQNTVLLQRAQLQIRSGKEICVSGLYHPFSVPLILLTNACGRPTLNVFERFWFWLGSIRSASKITQINSKELISELQMNSPVNCITMYKCT